jgi:tRNA/tmRNA/rRNA uracil-C5-methylase (TrmA/RlmC/RlmD family)
MDTRVLHIDDITGSGTINKCPIIDSVLNKCLLQIVDFLPEHIQKYLKIEKTKKMMTNTVVSKIMVK